MVLGLLCLYSITYVRKNRRLQELANVSSFYRSRRHSKLLYTSIVIWLVSCKWHWPLTPYINLLDIPFCSEEWWSFSIPYLAIHDYRIASLDSQNSDVETPCIIRNMGYFICTFILSLTFTFHEKQNWQTKRWVVKRKRNNWRKLALCVNCGCYLYAFYSRLDQFQIPCKTLAAHRILFVGIAARKLKRKDMACWACSQYVGNAVSMLPGCSTPVCYR